MNKAFKVIWNHATQSWTAVSEIARSKGKTKSVKTAKTALATAVAVAAVSTISTQALGAVAIGTMSGTTPAQGTAVASGWHAIAIGEASTATASRSTAIGHNAKSTGAHAIAIGTNANVTNQNAIAIGQDAKVETQMKGIAIGAGAQLIRMEDSQARASVVLGADALARNVSRIDQNRGITALGTNSLTGFLTPKDAAYGTAVSLTDADYATVSGDLTASRLMYRAGIVDENGVERTLINEEGINVNLRSNEATAIGYDSRAIGDQSIAIGAQVVAGHSSVAIGNNDMGAVTTPDALETYEKIVGTSLAANTETINGVSWYETTYAKEGSVAIGAKSHSNELFGTAIGTSAFVEAGAELGTAIGTGARVGNQTTPSGAGMSSTSLVSTKGGVAIAAGAVAEGDYTTAVGTGANALAVNATALGYKALANATNATAVGAAAIATADNALAYGANASAFAQDSVSIGTNSKVADTGISSIAFGSDTSVTGERSVALGNAIDSLSTDGSVVLGDRSTEVVTKQTEADGKVKNVTAGTDGMTVTPVETVKSVTIGSGAATLTYDGFAGQVSDAGQYVSVGRKDAERQIKNVAPGAITNVSTDAINGSQLYAALDVLGGQVGQIYFHTNNGTNAKTGDAVENIGNITEAAGAQGLYSTTAGVKSTATSQYGIAYGYNSTAVGGSDIDVTKGGAISLGSNTIAYDGGIAMGINSQIQGQPKFGASGAIAIGRDTIVDVMAGNAPGVIAIGNATYAKGIAAYNNGVQVTVKAKNGETLPLGAATAVGDHAYANAGSVAFGQVATADGQNATVLGTKALGSGHYTVAAGFEANATAESALALGRSANANNLRDTAIGALALANGGDSLAMGSSSKATGAYAIANGYFAGASGKNSIAIGAQTGASADRATAVGYYSKAKALDAAVFGSVANASAVNATAIGRMTNAMKTDSIAVGTFTHTPTVEAVAIGTNSATGVTRAEWDNLVALNAARLEQDAIWDKAVADADAQGLTGDDRKTFLDQYRPARGAAHSAENAARDALAAATTTEGEIVIGSHSLAKGNDSIIVGNDATVVGTQSTSVGYGHVIEANYSGTFGDPNYIRAGADRSYAFGNNNTITTADTFVLGSNVSRNADGTDNPLGTVKNSVYLGNGTEVTAGGAVGTAVLDTDQVAGATTTAGDTGTVADAKVGGLTYGGFAGDTANGAVSVGAAGDERRVQNVAAGEISATSTDAINGSQLYYVAEQAAKPFTVTANKNIDTAVMDPNDPTAELFAAEDGKQVQLGDTFSIEGAKDAVISERNTDAATAGDYSAKNIQTIVDDKGVQIQMSTNPVFNSTVIGGTLNQDGKPAGAPITIGTTDGKNVISNLTTTIQPPVAGETVTPKPTGDVLTNAATLGDVLNAGWTLQERGVNKDVVTPYDKVNFIDGAGTTVTVTPSTDGTSSDIKVDVNLSDSAIIGNITSTDGVAAPTTTEDGNKLANVSTVVGAINNSGWKTNSTTATGTAAETLVNPGETVNFEAGKNMEVTQNVTKVDGKDVISYTYATADDVTFNSTTIGGTKQGDTLVNPITIGTTVNPDDGTVVNTISNLTTTLPVDTTKGTFDPTTATTTNAATLGDVLNAGWNLKAADQTATDGALDFVKPYDTVEFKNGNGTTVASSTDGNVSSIQYDVKVDNSTVKINSTTGAIEAVQPVTQVNGDNVTGPVNLVDGNTTTVTNTPDGIKVEVNTGNTTVGTDGKAAPATDADADKVATVGDIINTINNVGWFTNSTTATGGAANTKISAGQAVNFEAGKNMEVTQTIENGNVTYTYATADDVTFNSTTIGGTKQGDTLVNPITIGTTVNPNGTVVNAINNLTTTLPEPSTVDGGKSGVAPTNPVTTNAATLGDVLNAGWNLKTADQGDLDFVKPYDTVNFVNGVGTSVESSTDGNVSNIQYNVNVDNSTTKITYVDATGGALTAETQPDGSVIYKDAAGKEYTGPVTSQITAVQPTTQVNGGNVTGPVNLVNGNTTTVTNTPAGIKVEVNTGNTTVGTDGKAAPVTTEDANKVATVGDIINTINGVGWFTNSTTATGGAANTKISAGKAVNFEAGKNMEVTQEVDADGNVTYTYATADDVTFNSTKVGGTYTDAQGNVVNNAPITIGTTPEGKNVISNLNSTLPTTVSTGDKANSTTKVDAPVIAAGDMTNAATLGDVLNAGWNLKTADQGDLDFVKPYDTVNFVNGTGTTVESSTDGNVSNIQYNVNVDGTTTEITYATKVNGKDVPVYQHVDGNYYTGENGTGTKVETPVTSRVSAILPTTQVNGDNVTGPVNLVDGDTTTVTNTPDGIKVEVNTGNTTVGNDGKAAPATDEDADKVATVGDIVNTINNTGWNLKENGTQKDLVTASNVVNFVDGAGTTANITTNQDGTISNVTYNVKYDGKTIKLNNAGELTAVASKPTVTSGGDGDINFANTSTTNVTVDPATGDIKVDVVTTPLTNAANGTVNTPAKPNAIATAGDVAKAINGSGFTAAVANTGTGESKDLGGDKLVNPGDTVTMTAGDNISITKEGLNYTVATKKDVAFDSVTVNKDLTVAPGANIDMGGNVVGNVGTGVADTDAVNVAQLKATQTTVGSADGTVKVNETVSANGQRHFDLSVDPTIIQPVVDRVNDLEDDMRAGLAGSAAMVNIPQVTRPGANLVGVGLGHHKGESAIAVGFSSASDNERLIFKMTGSANTQGDFTIGTGMGWQW
ncbi:YadA-like family protein [Moraxella sp. FZLJ2109]|uniref:YadA-like family protein n=1 Tax=Moraxella sp. FZLJ2109 TaxID=2961890 RepID=UPI0020C8D2A3|nr:YadA-like family protein [Moraxella sp. FZLJ2109]UTO23040.1 YadA-like family protein [Moraxella sp. FZLJ2109]